MSLCLRESYTTSGCHVFLTGSRIMSGKASVGHTWRRPWHCQTARPAPHAPAHFDVDHEANVMIAVS